jgi:iron complex outermembrane receptor protein
VNWGLRSLGNVIEDFALKLNFTRWQHDEIEIHEDGDAAVATSFDNQQFVYRGVFEQAKCGSLTGRFGFWGLRRDYKAVGEEALSPPIDQNAFAVFGLEELDFERVKFQFGGRLEHNRYEPQLVTSEIHHHTPQRTFTGASAAAGMHAGLWADGAFVVNYAHSHRAPALEELYYNGPHIGNLAFEIGNPEMESETGNGVEVSLRQQGEKASGDVNFFYYNFNSFVFPFATGEEKHGLQVIEYAQTDSRFLGAEANLNLLLRRNLWLNLGMDYVDAQEKATKAPLPRIPPLRGRAGLDLHYGRLAVKPEVVLASSQQQTYVGETRTPGYTVVNLKASYAFPQGHLIHQFAVNVFNIGDRLYRNHSSFIKDLAPEIGRGVRFTYRLRFF